MSSVTYDAKCSVCGKQYGCLYNPTGFECMGDPWRMNDEPKCKGILKITRTITRYGKYENDLQVNLGEREIIKENKNHE